MKYRGKTCILVAVFFYFCGCKKTIEMDGSKKMNTGSLVVNALLLIAVAVLYFFQFFGKTGDADTEPERKPERQMTEARGSASNIAYVNSDVLLEKYELVGKLAKQLERESRKKDADLTARQEELESEAAYFQESMQNQSLNEQSAQRIYDQLMAKQQEIYQMQEQYAAELSQKEFEMNLTLLDSVRNFLDRMNVDYRYDYILNFNASGSILQASDAHDITDEVLEGLNREYKAKYAPTEK
jgi:outer membrane protein